MYGAAGDLTPRREQDTKANVLVTSDFRFQTRRCECRRYASPVFMREPSTRKRSGGGHPTEAYLTKPDVKAAVRSFGLALGQTGPCPEPLGSTKESIVRWNPSRRVKSVAAGT